MKIFCSSDLHLGKMFLKSRKEEHQAFIDWLLQQVAKEQVDMVIIAQSIWRVSGVRVNFNLISKVLIV